MKNKQKNGAATFFKVISWVLWIGGFLVSIGSSATIGSNGYYSGFNIGVFFNQFISYIVYGCLCMCFAIFFDMLQDILEELRSIKYTLTQEKPTQKNKEEQIFHD